MNNVYTEEAIAATKARLGLDGPSTSSTSTGSTQVFVSTTWDGASSPARRFFSLIQDRMVNSLILNLISLFFLTIISFATGLYFSTKVGTKVDYLATLFALFLHAFPGILLLILLQVFAAVTGLFPGHRIPGLSLSGGAGASSCSAISTISSCRSSARFSPVSAAPCGCIRATMLDQLGQPYITSLRSRGISRAAGLFRARVP